MKSSLKPMIMLLLASLLMFSCKKKSDDEIQYQVTTVPLHMLGYSNVPSAVVNQYFFRQLPAAGGMGPYTWQFVSGTLPPGLTLGIKGRIKGTPAATGEYNYTLQVTDAKGATATCSYTQTISASGTVSFMLMTPQIPEYGQNQDVGYSFFVQGGTPPWKFTITGLPAGVVYDTLSGMIYGTCTSAFTGTIRIVLKDANGIEAAGSPSSVLFQVNPPVPVGGGGGGGGGVNCSSDYNGNYIGEFKYVYYVKGQDDTYNPVEGGFRLTLTLKCLATAGGSTVLNVTHAVCSDPNFGCQLGGCIPVSPTIAVLPADPPTNSSNPSEPGQGLIIFFPNGSSILTSNGPGNLNVTTSGRILSNSLDPAIQNSTWTATGGNFPSGSVPPGGPVTQFKSWNLVWSATK